MLSLHRFRSLSAARKFLVTTSLHIMNTVGWRHW